MHLSASGLFSSGNIGTIVAVLTLLIVAAGITGASFRSSKNTAILTRYKETAESWEAKSTAQDAQIGELQEQVGELQANLTAKDTVIGELNGRIKVLQELVTGKSAVEQLAAEHERFLGLYESRTGEMLTQIGAIRGDVRQLLERERGG